MNQKLKTFLVISAKSAITAAVTVLGPIFSDYKDYNLTSMHGWEHVGILVGAAIAGREASVWVPKLLAWANSPTNGVNQ